MLPDDPTADDAQIQLIRGHQVSVIGKRIRALRRDRMTLTQLAQASGVSVGVLSRLENGNGNPHFSALSALARVLDVHVSVFFESPATDSTVLADGTRLSLLDPRSEAQIELLSPDFHSPVVGVILTLPPGFQPDAQISARPGQQFEFILDGSVEFRIDREIHQLQRGDAILFGAGRPHSRHNASISVKAVILSYSTEARLETYFPKISSRTIRVPFVTPSKIVGGTK
jgi:transcriptional regulator with XRE-family HTH domain